MASYARQPTMYAAERYAYIGKDDSSGEPMFLDYGAKGNKKWFNSWSDLDGVDGLLNFEKLGSGMKVQNNMI